jgi:hypothetical protein
LTINARNVVDIDPHSQLVQHRPFASLRVTADG